MQYFNQFISEVRTLDIRTKEKFVTSDGQIIPNDRINPAEIPLEYTGFGKRAVFLDLYHYRDHDSSGPGPYIAEIVRLQQLAINDALCLTPEQLRLQLARLNQLAKQYSRVIRKIMEFHKGKETGTQNDRLFLELEIYPFFIVDPSPIGNIDDRFSHYLMEAAGIKRGALTGFINQVQQVLSESLDVSSRFGKGDGGDVDGSSGKKQVFKQNGYNRLALFCHYEDVIVTKNNAQQIAVQEGFVAPTSGIQLLEKYLDNADPDIRIRKARNTVADIEAVIPLLSEKGKSMANKELKDARKKNEKL